MLNGLISARDEDGLEEDLVGEWHVQKNFNRLRSGSECACARDCIDEETIRDSFLFHLLCSGF